MKLIEYVTGKICVPGVCECDILEVVNQNLEEIYYEEIRIGWRDGTGVNNSLLS